MISLNARGHSPSTDINAAAASFEVFADDVIALADHLGLVRFIIGGISLGAGTAGLHGAVIALLNHYERAPA